MSKNIAILRGINVGGKRKLLMDDLKKIFSSLGYSNVTSYIQSGNVIFDSSDNNLAQIEEEIQEAILKNLGLEIPVIIRSTAQFKSIVEKNPFRKENIKIESLYLTFLKEQPAQEHLNKIKDLDFSPDKFIIDHKEAFLCCPGKYHKSKLSNTFFEKKLKVGATTRNWKTILKLLELSESKS